jgi:hypothetical protein
VISLPLATSAVFIANGLATKTGGADSKAAAGTRLRGMRHTDSHFCFGRRSRRCSHRANIRIGQCLVARLLQPSHFDNMCGLTHRVVAMIVVVFNGIPEMPVTPLVIKRVTVCNLKDC